MFRREKAKVDNKTWKRVMGTPEIPNSCGVEETFIEDLIPLTEQVLSVGRQKLHCPTMTSAKVKGKSTYDGFTADRVYPVKDGESFNLISSKVMGKNHTHMPVIDIDVPIMAIPSSTPGHFHLYIDKAMSWSSYLAIIRALMDAGVVEEGWYNAVKAREQGCVRPPHLKKAHYYDLLLEGLNEMAKEA